jgi:hypothetical protein
VWFGFIGGADELTRGRSDIDGPYLTLSECAVDGRMGSRPAKSGLPKPRFEERKLLYCRLRRFIAEVAEANDSQFACVAEVRRHDERTPFSRCSDRCIQLSAMAVRVARHEHELNSRVECDRARFFESPRDMIEERRPSLKLEAGKGGENVTSDPHARGAAAFAAERWRDLNNPRFEALPIRRLAEAVSDGIGHFEPAIAAHRPQPASGFPEGRQCIGEHAEVGEGLRRVEVGSSRRFRVAYSIPSRTGLLEMSSRRGHVASPREQPTDLVESVGDLLRVAEARDHGIEFVVPWAVCRHDTELSSAAPVHRRAPRLPLSMG